MNRREFVGAAGVGLLSIGITGVVSETTAAAPNSLSERKETDMSAATQAVLERRLQAFGEGIDAVMAHYTDDSVVITPDGTYRGLAKIRDFFTALMEGLPEGTLDAFTMKRQEIVGEIAYILWEAKPWFPLGTDTFVIREGKIVFQTLTVYSASE